MALGTFHLRGSRFQPQGLGRLGAVHALPKSLPVDGRVFASPQEFAAAMTANRRVSLRPGGTFTIKTPASTLTRLHGADERFLVTTDKKFPASNIIVTAKSDAKSGDVEVSLNTYKADNGVAIARLLQGNLTPEMVRFTLVISAK